MSQQRQVIIYPVRVLKFVALEQIDEVDSNRFS
jgi:hypothetical protein